MHSSEDTESGCEREENVRWILFRILYCFDRPVNLARLTTLGRSLNREFCFHFLIDPLQTNHIRYACSVPDRTSDVGVLEETSRMFVYQMKLRITCREEMQD